MPFASTTMGMKDKLFEIAEGRIRPGFVSVASLVHGSFATIEKLQQHKGAVTGVPTGFTDLDALTSGLQAGDLIIVAARPSMGKTAFCLNVAQHAAIEEKVGVTSREVRTAELTVTST